MKKWIAVLFVLACLSWSLDSPGADFNGDGTNDIGIFRPDSGLWAIRNITRVYFGASADDPVPGDYNGDGIIDFGLFRPSTGMWAIRDISRIYFGNSGDDPLPGIPGGGAWRTSGGNVYRPSGYVGIGPENPSTALDVRADELGNHVAQFINTHSTANSWGIMVQSGSATSGTLIDFQNGSGGYIGWIENNNGTVVYHAFTGGHPATLSGNCTRENYAYGTVMTLCNTNSQPEVSHQVDYLVEPASKPYDKAVFGVYGGNAPRQDGIHTILALGDGHILVCREGGDIEIGDYLTTAGKTGHAMKQDDDLLHSYTVAKAQQPVSWENEESDSKLIACTYHAQ